MQYQTTRDQNLKLSFSEMVRATKPQEGFFVPDQIPVLSNQFLAELSKLDFISRAKKILAVFAPDLPDDLLQAICEDAWPKENFNEEIFYESKVLNPYLENPAFLFLTNGKTGSYLDFAQALVLSCIKHLARPDETWYLIANETTEHLKALAALNFETEQFKPIFVLDKKAAANYTLKEIQYVWNVNHYDAEPGQIQEQEAAEQKKFEKQAFPEEFIEDNKLSIFSVKGRVEDYEKFAEDFFSATDQIAALREQNKHIIHLGSQNFVYYIALMILLLSAYVDFLKDHILDQEEEFVLAFPNHNLDFLYTGILLKELGLPIASLAVACNQNKSFVDFLESGILDVKRKYFRTGTPGLDRIYYSTFERFIFEIVNRDVERSQKVMQDCANGSSENIENILKDLRYFIFANAVNHKTLKTTIDEWYLRTDYLFDPYTALTLENLTKIKKIDLKKHKVIIPVLEHPLLSSRICAEAILDDKQMKKKNFTQILDMVAEESGMHIPSAAKSGLARPTLIFVNNENAIEQIFTALLED